MIPGLDESKHTTEWIFEKQHAPSFGQELLRTFHNDLVQELNRQRLSGQARTHDIGITYLCDERKAFMYVNVRQTRVTAKFFTGNTSINGLEKDTWRDHEDNLSTEPYSITDYDSLSRAVRFALRAHLIAANWSR